LKKNAICNQRFLLFFRKGKKGSPFRPKWNLLLQKALNHISVSKKWEKWNAQDPD
jgi:hypothetical protein